MNAAPWNLSCPDWADRIRRGVSLIPDLPLDRAAADKAVAIFDCLRLPDVLGTPTLREAGGDWFREIVAALMGAVDTVTGERHIRGLFLLAPKKSSKTTYGAALMLVGLIVNRRPRAELLLVAPTKLIADTCFSQAVGMVQANEELAAMMYVQEHLRTITHIKTKAQLKIKAFDTGVLTGVKPTAILVDELHEIAKSPHAARIIGQLRGGLIPNKEGFLAFISTASDQPPAGVFRTELNNARDIRDGKINGSVLPVLYEFPPDMLDDGTWRDPKNWSMVTPNIGRSVELKRLVEDFELAQHGGEEESRRWASQHLNVQVGLELRSDRWVGANYWEACGDKSLTLDTLIERSEVITCGNDGGGLDDLNSLAVLGREAKTGKLLAWGHSWINEIVLERRKSEASRLRDFAACGDLTIVKPGGDDFRQAADLIERIDRAGKFPDINAVGVDRIGAKQMENEFLRRGFEKEKIVAVSQGYELNGAIKTCRETSIRRCAHPCRPASDGVVRFKCQDRATLQWRHDHESGIRCRQKLTD